QSTDTTFAAEIAAHRQHYKDDFIKEPYSPLKTADTAFLDFYLPDPAWRTSARFSPSREARPFDMLTYSGVKRQYQPYGQIQFDLQGQSYTLTLYQSLDLMKSPEYQDYLFLPFKDLGNGEETYGGGRYLDFRTGDIQDGLLLLDFNKAYNPYCAYKDGYSCPIPPKENHLDLAVQAGEKVFRGGKKH
ncbi:MAG: DUF1684 domain-containing protein, partial [Saprospiraceae bacterium]